MKGSKSIKTHNKCIRGYVERTMSYTALQRPRLGAGRLRAASLFPPFAQLDFKAGDPGVFWRGFHTHVQNTAPPSARQDLLCKITAGNN